MAAGHVRILEIKHSITTPAPGFCKTDLRNDEDVPLLYRSCLNAKPFS